MTQSPPDTKPEVVWVRDKRPETVRSMFHDIAPSYDKMNHILSMNVDKFWRRKAAKIVVTSDCKVQVDVCGGTGDMSIALRRQSASIGLEPDIMCMDFTYQMTRRAAIKFASIDAIKKPVALVGDTLVLPLRDSMCDLVTVVFGIRNVTDHRAGLREMVRICKPGGTVAVLEFSKSSFGPANWAYQTYFNHVLPRIGQVVTGTRAYQYLAKSVAAFPEGKEFADQLKAIAGGVVSMHRFTFGIATLYVAKVEKTS